MSTYLIPPSTYHFSVDDVFESLIEVSDNGTPLFDHPFFGFLKTLHDDYGATVECYLFYQNEVRDRLRSLREVFEGLRKTIESNPWLRFGPHALDYPHAPYDQKPVELEAVFDKIYAEITRFAGDKNFSSFARLHYFSEMYELAEYFRKRNLHALFSTDKNALSWRMPARVKEALRTKGRAQYQRMNFLRTHFRAEYAIRDYPTPAAREAFLKRLISTHGFIVFFTHECDIPNAQVRDYITDTLKLCRKWGVRSV